MTRERAPAVVLVALVAGLVGCGGNSGATSESWAGTFSGTATLGVDDPCFGGALVESGMLTMTMQGDLVATLRGDDQGLGVASGEGAWSCTTTVQQPSSATNCQLVAASVSDAAAIETSTNAGIAITLAKASVDPATEVQAGSTVATLAPTLRCAINSLGASVIARCNDGFYLDGTLTLVRQK